MLKGLHHHLLQLLPLYLHLPLLNNLLSQIHSQTCLARPLECLLLVHLLEVLEWVWEQVWEELVEWELL